MLGVFWGKASGSCAQPPIPMWLGSALGVVLFTLKMLTLATVTFVWIPPFFYETPFMMNGLYMFASASYCRSG